MAALLEEVEETLNAEQMVDLPKLRAFARYGIPASIRGEVWLYLLEVLSPDRTNEITSIRSKYQSYSSMDKSQTLSTRLRGECTRYYTRRLLPITRRRRPPLPGAALPLAHAAPQPPPQQQPQVDEPMDIVAFTTSVENILSAYLNRHRHVEYKTGLVQLVAPFVWTLKTEAGMYFCFERLMTKIEEGTLNTPLSARISFFLSLFRQFLPDLWAYFDEEGVAVRELASAWLQWFFAKEMGIESLMRLWDVYFAVDDLVDLHQYVCLAILTTCKETLEELDESEVRSFLLNLPAMDVDRLVVEANNIRHAFQHLQTRGEKHADFLTVQ
ncbi:RabGAP/TBC [Meredithblackwellia eburnea MCA 4105]